MTDDEIKALMRATDTDGYPSDLRRFVEAVQEREREACASFVLHQYERQFTTPWREHLADAIRNRGKS